MMIEHQHQSRVTTERSNSYVFASSGTIQAQKGIQRFFLVLHDLFFAWKGHMPSRDSQMTYLRRQS